VTVLEDQLSLDMILQILLQQIDLGSFLMVVARSILLAIFIPAGCYVLDNGDSCSQLPIDVDQVDRLFLPGILVLVLLPMVIYYFNGCTRARSLGIVAQIKIMGEPSLVFLDLWFRIYLRLPQGTYKIVSWKKKEFEGLKYLLVSFGLYFIIVEVSSCISTMYYLLL
jgi:hypothetical protein